MNRYLLIFICILLPNVLRGQESLTSDSCRNLRIKYFATKYSGQYRSGFDMGGRVLSKSQLAERLAIFPESAREHKLFKKSIRAAWISFAIGFPLLVAGNIYGHQQNVSAGILLGSTVVLVYAIEIPGFLALKHRKRSIILYNKRICEH